MSEVADLKNHVVALSSKLNSFIEIASRSNVTQEKVNEILNLIHNLGFEREKTKNIMFDSVFPDVVHRINELEKKQGRFGKVIYKPGDYFDILYQKGRKKEQIHVYITPYGVNFYRDDDNVRYTIEFPTKPDSAKLKKEFNNTKKEKVKCRTPKKK